MTEVGAQQEEEARRALEGGLPWPVTTDTARQYWRDTVDAYRAAIEARVGARYTALVEAARGWAALIDRWNETDWDDEDEFDRAQAVVFVKVAAALAHLEEAEA